MTHIKCNRVIWVDVDSTLVQHVQDTLGPYQYLRIPDPVIPGTFIVVRPLEGNIRLIKEEWARGSCVIVHSKGGDQWANDVAKALGLSKYVRFALTKPTAYIDDKPVSEWLTDRIFIPDSEPYKTRG